MRAANLKNCLVVLMFLVVTLGTARGQIIYVDVGAAGPTHDGTSWQNGYQYLQDALADANLAVKPVEIRVAQGTYMPDTNSDETGGSGDRAAAFQLIEGVTIKGGYAGWGEPDANARDIELYKTILSGDLDGNDVGVIDPCDLQDEPTRGENSYHVVIGTGADATAVLDGFTITGGNAKGPDPNDRDGGGMYCENSSPTVTDCNFTRNSAKDWGGGMYCENSFSQTVTDCNFSGNSAGWGGGMANNSSTPTLTDCRFTGNVATDGGGGGMFNAFANQYLSNCTFSGNSSNYHGGGMYNHSCGPHMIDCNFSGNSTTGSGGAIHNWYGHPWVIDCNFSENIADVEGGGMSNNHSFGGMSPTVTGCYFTGNTADANGGGMYNNDSNAMVTNCTFSGNSAAKGGGMYNNDNSSPTVTDCNFSNNSADIDAGGMYNNNSSATVSNCSFSGNSVVYSGAGMYNNNSSPNVADCTFSQNTANTAGGMVNVDGSNPEVTNCTFSGNTATSSVWGGAGMCNLVNSSPMVINCAFADNAATYDGGGMSNYDNSSPTVTDCNFIHNSADYGGGMCNYTSSPTVTDCNFTENSADHGGGMFSWKDSSPTVTDCTFTGNTADEYGGGMYNYNSSSATVTNCTFTGNESQAGGGMLNEDGSSPSVTNCIFSGNSAGWGAGMWNYGSSPTLTNCTFSDNAGGTGGGMYNEAGSNPTVANCILWGNTSNEIVDVDSAADVSYSDVQGGTSQSWFGTGCVDADPLFVNAAGGDLRLSSSASPCVDAGDNNSVPPDTADLDGDGNTVELIPWDLDGGARIADGNNDGNSVVDMGAYERRKRIYVDVDAPGPVHDGTSWTNAYKYLQEGLSDADSNVKPVEIWVAEGTYNPDANSSSPDGTGDRDAAFHLIDHVTVMGGFAGYGEPNCDGRDIELYETILSGDLDGNDTDVKQPWRLPYDANRGENSYHVVVAFEVDGSAVLDAFTVTGGYANGFGGEGRAGGGMLCFDGSPMVLNCTFIMNSASEGGGMANFGGHPVVTGCTFTSNAAGGGGGIFNFEVNPPITITNCLFVGNLAEGGGAVVNLAVASAMINCRFSGNRAYVGGAVYGEESNSVMTNCTFGGNYAGDVGGAVLDVAGQLELGNCILWCDAAADGNEIAVVEGSTVDVNYCDVKGGEVDIFDDGGSGTVNWDPGNMEEDPDFVSPGYWGDVNDISTSVEPDDPNAVWVDGDYRLLGGSPCIDTADNNSVPEDTVDLDGDGNTVEVLPWDLDCGPRIKDGDGDGNAVVDMGAYELAIPPVPPVPATMKFTPQALNTCSNGKAKVHFVFPEEYEVEDINTAVPATLSLLGVEVQSEEIKILGDKKSKGPVKVQITFYRAGLCVIETDEDYAEVTVTGYFTNGQKYMGTDTIKIITNPQ